MGILAAQGPRRAERRDDARRVLDPREGLMTVLVRTVGDAHDMAWTDDEVAVLGAGGVVVWDGAIDRAACASLREMLDASWQAGALHAAGVGQGRTGHGHVRDDHIAWWSSEVHPAVTRLHDALLRTAREDAWLAVHDAELQAAVYGPGGHYDRHVDALRGTTTRRVTAVLWLNPEWRAEHGGALRVWTDGGAHELTPLEGRLAIFLSDKVPHEVLPTHAPRYALTFWLRARGLTG